MTELEVTVRNPSSWDLVIEASGDLSCAGASAFVEATGAQPGPSPVLSCLIDLTEIDTVDAVGVRALLRLRSRLISRGVAPMIVLSDAARRSIQRCAIAGIPRAAELCDVGVVSNEH